jgi:hypothetical protein
LTDPPKTLNKEKENPTEFINIQTTKANNNVVAPDYSTNIGLDILGQW